MSKNGLLALVGFLLSGAFRAWAAEPALELRLLGGTFRPLAPESDSPIWFEETPLDTSVGGDRYMVAITRAPLDPDGRRRIEEAGAELLDYLPVRGYRLRVPPASEISIRELTGVEWLGRIPAHFKVAPELAARAETASGGAVSVRIVLERGEGVTRVLEATRGLKVQSAPSGKEGAWRVVATVPETRLRELLSRVASLPEVEAVEPVRHVVPLNQDAVWAHQSFVGPSPQQTPAFDRGIYGCGQIVAIADTGQDYGACFFRDAVNGPPPISSCSAAPCPPASPAMSRRKDILYYNWSTTPTGDDDTCPATLGSSGHGTHTSGSIAGDNAPYADCSGFTTPGRNGGDGQAPGAKLVIEEMGDGLEYLNNLGGTVWNLADVAFQAGARIHSNSWGGACHDLLGNCIPGCTMPYDSYARDADVAMWTYPDLLMVFSAGNAGEFCPPPVAVGTPAIAKNPLVVGSVGHGASADTPSTFTSPGPVFDGRLKPTVAAQGEGTFSAASDANPTTSNCSICSLDGSSMSAPTAAGHAALVREYYAAGFYAAGARNPVVGFVPSGALLKATLIEGAVALGASTPSPDFVAGYGRILLGSTLAFGGSPFKLRVDDHRQGITTGSVVTHAYDVSPGAPFRATLVWTDFPAALNAAAARVNELKLEVVDPSGSVWFQTLDPGTGTPVQTSSPSDLHDSVNVEERLVFPSPAGGRWIVRVLGIDVPWGPQPFALVVRGALEDCAAPPAPGPLTLTTSADQQVQVSWGSVPGAIRYNVVRSFGSCPAGPWVPVGTALSGTTFLDTTVSGGVRYSYQVTAASDAAAACVSPRSPCADVVPTGECTLPPEFRGVTDAASAGNPACAVTLSWNPATTRCLGDVRYNVYRSPTGGFTPGPGNRIARCVIGTGYTDAAALASGTTYYYSVRAEDRTSGHAGPCGGGNEDANGVEVSASPDGPPIIGTFGDDAGDTGVAKLAGTQGWIGAATGGNVGPRVYTVASSEGVCADLTTPPLTLADPGQGPLLSFATRHDLEFDPEGLFGAEGSIGQVEIATGPAFDNWTRLPLAPDYPTFVDFTLINCTSTLDGMTYFTSVAPSYLAYGASLANWGGGDVRIRFHVSGDYFYPTGNWWIDDVRVTQTLVPDACTSLGTGPPPVPDGAAVPGVPLRASRSGSDVVITWDATRCPATAVNVYRGAIGSYTTFTGGICSLPPTGSATLALPNNVWFLVAATDGGATDGSWGRTLTGAERSYAGASLACPAITAHVTNNGCP